MALLVLYFSPDHLRDPQNFLAVANRLICSPVTQVLVFTKVRLLQSLQADNLRWIRLRCV